MNKLRTVVESETTEQKVNKCRGKNDHFSDAFDALVWLLARNCERMGEPIALTTLKVYKQAKAETGFPQPEIVVIFNYDDNTVTLHDIKI